jgi:predicted ABC-type ATPase
MKPQLWLLVGGNGAGKSTFYHRFLRERGVQFVNADQIARAIAPDAPEAASYEAAQLAAELRRTLLARRASFCFETVFSHPSKLDFVAEAKAAGYEIVMVFIHLESGALNLGRIAQRVAEGGHHVPPEKVAERLERLQPQVLAALPLVDQLHVLDNSSIDHPYLIQLRFEQGRLVHQAARLKPWVRRLFAGWLPPRPTLKSVRK